MEFIEVSPLSVPLDLLLEADPSHDSIQSYVNESRCFVIKRLGEVVGACLVQCHADNAAEILNLAVYPEFQSQGLGSGLLRFVLSSLRAEKRTCVELGTGTFGYQLTFYQRLGFRVNSVEKDYFLNHYPEPIFENGIQHKDMLRLSIELTP